ncbi:MAG: diaminopimelate epimerase [Actinobacteria bacterium 13_1_20CM_4_68_12]|nr:MAG: diaminopimelate epimerase [Actinobacteria bacterium 13_1_20CM_4_68_12]
MRSSKWSAHGNIYLLVEDERLTPERARELSAQHKTDGVLEVVSVEGVEAEIAIWNPDGSRAELSGNGTRIAARWLADRSRAGEVRIRVGERVTHARMSGELVEQELGPVEVGPAERLQGIEFVPVSVGNPHAVVEGDPAEIERVGPLLETNPRFPGRTNVQIGRPDGPSRIVARIWERGVGETSSSGTSAVAVAAALRGEGETEVSFPGGVVRVRIEGGLAYVTGPAERLD